MSKDKEQKIVKDWIDELDEDPILPDKLSDRAHTSHDGWKFYVRIKDYLPDWWEEFNSTDISKKRGPYRKYKHIQQLVKAKVPDRRSRQYLLWMIGPRATWREEAKIQGSKKYVVPWLGDWQQRRKNGQWLEGNKPQIKELRKAIHENLNATTAIRATAPFIIQCLLRKVKLQEKIDEMFAGEPFYTDEKPDSKNNKARFHQYKALHDEVEKSMYKAIHEWMRIHGINPRNPHEMADMATLAGAFGQIGAAGALTGVQAALQMQPLGDANGQPNGSHMLTTGDNRVVISPQALLLAEHLTQHSNTFKKPLPSIVEGEIVEKEQKTNGKSNGHAKAN